MIEERAFAKSSLYKKKYKYLHLPIYANKTVQYKVMASPLDTAQQQAPPKARVPRRALPAGGRVEVVATATNAVNRAKIHASDSARKKDATRTMRGSSMARQRR